VAGAGERKTATFVIAGCHKDRPASAVRSWCDVASGATGWKKARRSLPLFFPAIIFKDLFRMTFSRVSGAGFRTLLFYLCAVICAAAAAAAPAPGAGQTAAQQSGTVAGRASWDANYLYLAFQIDDANLQGTNSAPLSQPQQDDSVAVYLQMGQGEQRPASSNANTHAMIVSAAGGFTFLSGTGPNGALAPRPLTDLLKLRGVKYAVTLQGTLNRTDDRDQRFTVEMAIPWDLIGLSAPPQAGLTLGYNVVARSRGDSPATALAAPGASNSAATEADIADPRKWTTLTLQESSGAPTPGAATGRVAVRTSPEVAPLINGVLQAGEWPDRSLFAFRAPDKTPLRAGPAVVTGPENGAAPPVNLPRLDLSRPLGDALERLIFARYVLALQGDPRKPTAFRGVRAAPMPDVFFCPTSPLSARGHGSRRTVPAGTGSSLPKCGV
jgi:hypothetical protein